MNADCAGLRIRRLSGRSFEKTVQRGVVLVDFGEPWCGVCRMQLAILENLATRIGSQAELAEVNVDEARDLAERFRIETLPTLLLFKNGRLWRQLVGVQRESRLAKAIEVLAAE